MQQDKAELQRVPVGMRCDATSPAPSDVGLAGLVSREETAACRGCGRGREGCDTAGLGEEWEFVGQEE